jgi:hypothetical protein
VSAKRKTRFLADGSVVLPPKRGRGRPPIDPAGGVRLDADVTRAHAELLDELDQAHELGGRAATLRAVLSAVREDPKARAAVERALKP